ncbi:isoprenylcysteine carboxylmethyltransferase family protein [Bisgaard Taxon 10/6]|uniref:methyltransferase family protein n=1 Tax=Exercitatus varius TaxID=67857 RepID=UPI00294B854F|nr:isoprenylcysteine carboxylmethyltransferase family protein [Exercitatus varius]MDG2960215.1 isoprenylcysteine carboxylmethyltransferase family protein [Exercitatus varius]
MKLKLPPPVLFLLGIALIACLPAFPLPFSTAVRIGLCGALLLIGTVFAAAGFFAFMRQKTTLSPQSPERSSTLVTDGIFRISRNPMYLSLVIWLTAWAIWRESPLGFVVIILFALYLTYFQIKPEEQALERKFGRVFLQYKQSVRRWI